MSTGQVRSWLAAAACAVFLLAPSAMVAADLEVGLAAAKTEVLVGEPLIAIVTLKGTRPVMIDSDLTNEQGRLVLLVDRGGGFVPYHPPVFAYVQREALQPQPLPPSGLVVEYLLSYDKGISDWVLPSPGQYRLVAEYREPGLAAVRSPIVTVKVHAPTGDEAAVLAEVARLDRTTLAAEGTKPALLEIAQRYPTSVYLQHARLSALEERISSLWDGHDPEDAGAESGNDRKAIEAFARERIARLVPDLHDLAGAAGQFAPQALHALAGVQEAAGDFAGARATNERIVREYPNRSVAALARDALGDETAPTLAVSASPLQLWPPNNKLVTITVAVIISDDMDESPSVGLVSIACDDGCDAAQDIAGATLGTDDRSFQLRATRRGGGTGRTYAITYSATDDAGNQATAQTTVRVPHDQGK
jgi:hypothetical protein